MEYSQVESDRAALCISRPIFARPNPRLQIYIDNDVKIESAKCAFASRIGTLADEQAVDFEIIQYLDHVQHFLGNQMS